MKYFPDRQMNINRAEALKAAETESWKNLGEAQSWRNQAETQSWRNQAENQNWRNQAENQNWRNQAENQTWRSRAEAQRWRDHVVHKVIDMRCTNSFIATICLAIGGVVVLLQVVSLGSEHWLYVVEPRELNITVPGKDDPEIGLFMFNSGYWRFCRDVHSDSAYNYTAEATEALKNESNICMSSQLFNPPEEIQDFAKAVGAILAKCKWSAIFHIASVIMCIISTAFCIIGYCKSNSRTLYSSVGFIITGLIMATSVLQFICVVDEEMKPRLEPSAEGESSLYAYQYGWSFFIGSASFIGIQICALLNLILYLRRFPNVEDKVQMIPGLQQRIERMYQDINNYGFSPPEYENRRRGSRKLSLMDVVPNEYFSDLV